MQRPDSNDGELNNLMKQFWSLESIGIMPRVDQQLTPDEKLAINKVGKSMRFTGEKYEVAVPWKHDRPHLQSNWTPICQLNFIIVVESFNEAYEEGEMSNSQRQGVITLIEKNRSRQYPS